MKKRILAIVLIFACFGAFTSCNRQIQSKDIYGFPEPTQQINIIKLSAAQETEYTIGSENYDSEDLSVMPILEWFYGLELTECEEPEMWREMKVILSLSTINQYFPMITGEMKLISLSVTNGIR